MQFSSKKNATEMQVFPFIVFFYQLWAISKYINEPSSHPSKSGPPMISIYFAVESCWRQKTKYRLEYLHVSHAALNGVKRNKYKAMGQQTKKKYLCAFVQSLGCFRFLLMPSMVQHCIARIFIYTLHLVFISSTMGCLLRNCTPRHFRSLIRHIIWL